MRNLSNAVPIILREIQKDINNQFPDFKLFEFNKKDASYTWKQANTRAALKQIYPEHVNKWNKTDKGSMSLSLKAFDKFFTERHDFPRDELGPQLKRYLKTKQHFNGFTTSEDSERKTIWDSLVMMEG